jgi:hypothetical protein
MLRLVMGYSRYCSVRVYRYRYRYSRWGPAAVASVQNVRTCVMQVR